MLRTPLLAVLCSALLAGPAAGGPPSAKDKPLDANYLRRHALTRGFLLGRPVQPKPTPDGKAVLFLRAASRLAEALRLEFGHGVGVGRRQQHGRVAIDAQHRQAQARQQADAGGRPLAGDGQ